MSKSRYFLLLYSLFFSACGATQTSAPIPTSTLYPTLLPTSVPTSTLVPNNCSKTQKSYEPFTMPVSWGTLSDPLGMNPEIHRSFVDDFEKTLIDYLNQNGSPYQLQNDMSYTDGIVYVDIREHDFDKDGENEILLSTQIYKEGEFKESLLLIAKCYQSKYQFVSKMDNFGDLSGAPRILLIKDMNKDGYDEAIWKANWSGSDLMPFVYVMAWDENKNSFVDIFKREGIPLGNVKITIGDIDNNGIDEISFYGRLNHRGDMRTMVTYTYTWDGEYYVQIKEEIHQ